MISKRLNHIFTVGCFHSNVKVVYHFKTKKFQMLFEQNIASNVTRNAEAQTYKT